MISYTEVDEEWGHVTCMNPPISRPDVRVPVPLTVKVPRLTAYPDQLNPGELKCAREFSPLKLVIADAAIMALAEAEFAIATPVAISPATSRAIPLPSDRAFARQLLGE